jgi:hypothetical protein
MAIPSHNEEILQRIDRFESIRGALPSPTVGYITARLSERRLAERIPRLSGKEFRDYISIPKRRPSDTNTWRNMPGYGPPSAKSSLVVEIILI